MTLPAEGHEIDCSEPGLPWVFPQVRLRHSRADRRLEATCAHCGGVVAWISDDVACRYGALDAWCERVGVTQREADRAYLLDHFSRPSRSTPRTPSTKGA